MERITRTHVAIGAVVLVVVLLAVGIPLYRGSSVKARRDEVPAYVEQIRVALIAYHAAFGEYTGADPAPRDAGALDETAVPWVSSTDGVVDEGYRGFVRMAWEPPDLSAVYGSYSIRLTDTGFVVTGLCDVDGDGRRAEFRATEDLSKPVEMISDPSVY